jgi:hypothetical protein
VKRFNALSKIVEADRMSTNAKKAEDEVLLTLRRAKCGDSINNEMVRDPEEERQRCRAMPEVVEAFCEL